jgi:CelD/BcsL family acetyltransferase involved in cellulose biosynthesis
VLSLPASLEQWAGGGPSGLLQQARYAWRGAEQLGTPRFERAEDANFEALFSALVWLHEARWRARCGAGMLAEKPVQEFHREAARGLLAAGALRLYGLRLNDQWAASFYGFQQAGRAYYYLGGFDPALGPLSLGTLMVSHAIESAIREGAREFDFLRGSEGYKYRWGARDRATYRRTLRARAAVPPEPPEPAGKAMEQSYGNDDPRR